MLRLISLGEEERDNTLGKETDEWLKVSFKVGEVRWVELV